jgi:formaldehyde-activating enzyme involved in methanogenesis
MKIKKVFGITFGGDFCSVTFGTELEETTEDANALFDLAKAKTVRDIKRSMKEDPFIKKIIDGAKSRASKNSAEEDAAEILRTL